VIRKPINQPQKDLKFNTKGNRLKTTTQIIAVTK